MDKKRWRVVQYEKRCRVVQYEKRWRFVQYMAENQSFRSQEHTSPAPASHVTAMTRYRLLIADKFLDSVADACETPPQQISPDGQVIIRYSRGISILHW